MKDKQSDKSAYDVVYSYIRHCIKGSDVVFREDLIECMQDAPQFCNNTIGQVMSRKGYKLMTVRRDGERKQAYVRLKQPCTPKKRLVYEKPAIVEAHKMAQSIMDFNATEARKRGQELNLDYDTLLEDCVKTQRDKQAAESTIKYLKEHGKDWSKKPDPIPEYNTAELEALRVFLETRDEAGNKNGYRIGSYYDPYKPETWDGVEWSKRKGTKYVRRIYWDKRGLVGSIDLSALLFVEYINVTSNNLNEIILPSSGETHHIFCTGNNISCIDVSCQKKLNVLHVSQNRLKALDVSGCPRLTQLSCSKNAIETLDVRKLPLLKLYCSCNRLSELDLTDQSRLTHLGCWRNDLRTLDVSSCTRLKTLRCDGNQIKELDITANTELVNLNCSDNKLYMLDVSKNNKLTRFNMRHLANDTHPEEEE